jgi:hypothetical protein
MKIKGNQKFELYMHYMMNMVLGDVDVFSLFCKWLRSGDVWNRIFLLLDSVVYKFLCRMHTNTARDYLVVHYICNRWKDMPGKL